MKKTSWAAAIVASFLLLSLTACTPSGGNPVKPENEDVDNAIKGTLTISETWPGKDEKGDPITYFINSTYTIKEGGNLTIEEGAIVKFGPSGKITIEKTGVIIASGTIFTSYRNPIGRTISINGGVDPAPGDWLNIYVNGGHSEFYDCEFSYGGKNTSTVYVYSSYATCKIDGCIFKYNDGTKSVSITVDAALRYNENVPSGEDNTVTNTTFENNVWPLSMSPSYSVSGTNHFGKADKANEYNLIHFDDDNVTGTVVWEHLEIPYLYAGTTNTMKIGESNKSGNLTIKGGTKDDPTIVEFYTKGFNITKNQGVLNLENNIHFTNCDKIPTTKYPGLHCDKSIKWKVIKGKTTYSYSESNPLLISNESMNIIIDGYQATDKYSSEDYYENRQCVIKDINTYETIDLGSFQE